MSGSSDEETEARYYGLELATVTDVEDPLDLGRVKVRIPGLYDDGDSPWALPLGTANGGGPQRGAFNVPPKGSDVGILFHRGDPEAPHYIGGHWGTPSAGTEVPTPVRAAAQRAPGQGYRVKAFETDRWLVTYDDSPGVESLRIEDKESTCHVELDGKTLGVTIEGDTLVNIRSGGIVNIDGLEVQIAGRKVLRNGQPI